MNSLKFSRFLSIRALQLNGDMSELFASFLKVSDPFMAGSCSALVKVKFMFLNLKLPLEFCFDFNIL